MKWISIKNKKKRPVLGRQYLCCNKKTGRKETLNYLEWCGDRRRRVFSKKMNYSDLGEQSWDITHWMELPENPK